MNINTLIANGIADQRERGDQHLKVMTTLTALLQQMVDNQKKG